MELSSKYKRIITFCKQKYMSIITIKSVHLYLWPTQNKMHVEC